MCSSQTLFCSLKPGWHNPVWHSLVGRYLNTWSVWHWRGRKCLEYMSQIIDATLQWPSPFHFNCFEWIGLYLFMPSEPDTICPFQVDSRPSLETLITELGWDVRDACRSYLRHIRLFNYLINGPKAVFFFGSILSSL